MTLQLRHLEGPEPDTTLPTVARIVTPNIVNSHNYLLKSFRPEIIGYPQFRFASLNLRRARPRCRCYTRTARASEFPVDFLFVPAPSLRFREQNRKQSGNRTANP